MPYIALTTPYDPGELDTGDYPDAKAVDIHIFYGDKVGKRIVVKVNFGESVAGEWEHGLAEDMTFIIADQPKEGEYDYSDMIGQGTWKAWETLLYTFLKGVEARLAGVTQQTG